MTNTTVKIYRHAVLCPACRRKLMTVSRETSEPPKVEVHNEKNVKQYSAETRCPGCRLFVGIYR